MFFQAKKQALTPYKIKEITDSVEVKRALKNVVEFEQKKDWENLFVAYFPEEDILVCQGLHQEDHIFRLSDGNKNEQEIGNPQYMKYSPGHIFRYNNFYNGMEMSAGFIQKKENGIYKTIFDIHKVSQSASKPFYIMPVDFFWETNTIFYLKSSNYSDEKGDYSSFYKFIIIEKEIDSWEKLPVAKFPVVDSTNFDNFDYDFKKFEKTDDFFSKKLNLQKINPNINNVYGRYLVPFSDQYTSIVLTYQEGSVELYTSIFNVDNQGNVIDHLVIAYDETAESFSRTLSTIDKGKIVVENWLYTQETPQKDITTYTIDKQGKFIKKSRITTTISSEENK